MGIYSWRTSDTNRTIGTCDSGEPMFPCYVICPDDSIIEDTDYAGYGIFGGQDIYTLLAQWNVPEKCTGNTNIDHMLGAAIGFNFDFDLKYPIKIVEFNKYKYDDVPAAQLYVYDEVYNMEEKDENLS